MLREIHGGFIESEQPQKMPGLHHADDTTALTTHAGVPGNFTKKMRELRLLQPSTGDGSPTFARATVRRRSPGHHSESEKWRRPPRPRWVARHQLSESWKCNHQFSSNQLNLLKRLKLVVFLRNQMISRDLKKIQE